MYICVSYSTVLGGQKAQNPMSGITDYHVGALKGRATSHHFTPRLPTMLILVPTINPVLILECEGAMHDD